jgi:hypothetical protein
MEKTFFGSVFWNFFFPQTDNTIFSLFLDNIQHIVRLEFLELVGIRRQQFAAVLFVFLANRIVGQRVRSFFAALGPTAGRDANRPNLERRHFSRCFIFLPQDSSGFIDGLFGMKNKFSVGLTRLKPVS